MRALARHPHLDRNRAGRFVVTPLCDGCNRPVGTSFFTDDEVCGTTDGPGFYLCDRAACMRRRDLPTAERRSLYETNRARRTP
jgi:hypothetical protein